MSAYDTWALVSSLFRQVVGAFGQAQLISLAEGPLMATCGWSPAISAPP